MYIVPITPMKMVLGEQPEMQQRSAATNVPFADILKDSINNLQELQAVSQQDAYDLAMGNAADIETIMINSAKATAAMELTVQVATRAVNAYKEILQMQI